MNRNDQGESFGSRINARPGAIRPLDDTRSVWQRLDRKVGRELDFFAGGEGIAGQFRKYLLSRPNWGPSTLVTVEEIARRLDTLAAALAGEAARFRALATEVKQRLEAEHQLPSPLRPRISELVRPRTAASSPPFPTPDRKTGGTGGYHAAE